MPARDTFVEPLERFSNVGLALGVDVEVVVKLVGEGGEILKLAIEALDARGGVGAGREPFNSVGVLIEEFDVKANADDGKDAGLGDLVLLGGSERLGFFFLRVERRGDEQRNGDQSEIAAIASIHVG